MSDTHLPRGQRRLPEACLERLRRADAILHAGDFSRVEVLRELEALGPPVHAVQGNTDDDVLRAELPVRRVVELAGARVGMVHDAGPAPGRLERQRALFARDAVSAVVFGHSHIPLRETSADGAFAIFNPGSATDRRREPRHTMGEASIAANGALRFDHVALD